jgi:hypothetical protein
VLVDNNRLAGAAERNQVIVIGILRSFSVVPVRTHLKAVIWVDENYRRWRRHLMNRREPPLSVGFPTVPRNISIAERLAMVHGIGWEQPTLGQR